MKKMIPNNQNRKEDAGIFFDLETAYFGGLTRGLSQTRVMAANYQSRFVRPADLDAFLQGCVNN